MKAKQSDRIDWERLRATFLATLEKLDLSYAEAAIKIGGCNQSTLWRLLHAKTQCNLNLYCGICDFLGVSLDKFRSTR